MHAVHAEQLIAKRGDRNHVSTFVGQIRAWPVAIVEEMRPGKEKRVGEIGRLAALDRGPVLSPV
jgi:hypothetical protein